MPDFRVQRQPRDSTLALDALSVNRNSDTSYLSEAGRDHRRTTNAIHHLRLAIKDLRTRFPLWHTDYLDADEMIKLNTIHTVQQAVAMLLTYVAHGLLAQYSPRDFKDPERNDEKARECVETYRYMHDALAIWMRQILIAGEELAFELSYTRMDATRVLFAVLRDAVDATADREGETSYRVIWGIPFSGTEYSVSQRWLPAVIDKSLEETSSNFSALSRRHPFLSTYPYPFRDANLNFLNAEWALIRVNNLSSRFSPIGEFHQELDVSSSNLPSFQLMLNGMTAYFAMLADYFHLIYQRIRNPFEEILETYASVRRQLVRIFDRITLHNPGDYLPGTLLELEYEHDRVATILDYCVRGHNRSQPHNPWAMMADGDAQNLFEKTFEEWLPRLENGIPVRMEEEPDRSVHSSAFSDPE